MIDLAIKTVKHSQKKQQATNEKDASLMVPIIARKQS